MWWLVLLLPLFGDFSVAAMPKEVSSQPSPNGGLASVLESEGELVQSLKTDLRDMNFMQQLTTNAIKFDNYSQTYSQNVLRKITELRSLIISGEDYLFDAIQPVHGWCATAKDLLEAYTSLFEESNAESIQAQNQIIQSMFAEDVITTVSNEMNKLSTNLNTASSTLSSIFTQFDADFSEQSQFFQSTLRNEFVKENNTRYTPDLINSIIAALMKYRYNPEQANREKVTPGEASKAQQALHSTEATQETLSPATIDPKPYLPYKNRVSSRFGQTKEFFKNFELHLNEMIRHTNEVKSKLAQNDHLAKTSKIAENTVSTRLTAAQENQMKRAAQTLKYQCKNFNATPLKDTFK